MGMLNIFSHGIWQVINLIISYNLTEKHTVNLSLNFPW
jgi:hypothetical protein